MMRGKMGGNVVLIRRQLGPVLRRLRHAGRVRLLLLLLLLLPRRLLLPLPPALP